MFLRSADLSLLNKFNFKDHSCASLRRIGIAKLAVVEIVRIVEDSRASKVGGINAGFDMFESSVLPSLLHNCETWDYISKKTVRTLDNYFNYFLRKILRVCTGAPIPQLYWQTGFLKAGSYILQRKLLFCHHLANLPEGTLGRDFYDLQSNLNIDGLVHEI